MTAGSEIKGEAVESGAHKRELGIEASVEISGSLTSVTRGRGLGGSPLALHLQQGRELIVEAAPEGVDRQEAEITGPTGHRQAITTCTGPGQLQLIQQHRLQATPDEASPDFTALLPAQAEIHLAASFGQPGAVHGVATIPEPATGLERPTRQTEQLRLLHGDATGDRQGLKIELPLACEQALQGLKQPTGAEGEAQPIEREGPGLPEVAAGAAGEGQLAGVTLQPHGLREPAPIQSCQQLARCRRRLGLEAEISSARGCAEQLSLPGFLELQRTHARALHQELKIGDKGLQRAADLPPRRELAAQAGADQGAEAIEAIAP